MKYKKGDKVILLPTVRNVGVRQRSIGKECVVISYYTPWNGYERICVQEPGVVGRWYIGEHMVKLVNPIGKQLEFDFMR